MGRRRQFDRADAIKAAMELFWRQGYLGVSIRDLGTQLDIQPGSLYQTFGNKERLFGEVLEAYGRENAMILSECLGSKANPLEGYREFLRRISLGERQCKTCMVARASGAMAVPPKIREQAQQMMQAFEQQLESWLLDLKASGSLAVDTEVRQLARLIQTQIIGIRTLADSGMDPRHVEETITLQIQGVAPLFYGA